MSAIESFAGTHAHGPTHIDTYTGISVDLADPDPADIRLEDIARGLSMTVRFAGQISRFYSVAEHSVLVLHLLEKLYQPGPNVARWTLLHDAPEAYLGDLVTGLKRIVGPLFKPIEEKWEAAIMKHYDVRRPSPGALAVIKEMDVRARYLEGAVLKPAERTWQGSERTELPEKVRGPEGVPWESAETRFLKEARRLGLHD